MHPIRPGKPAKERASALTRTMQPVPLREAPPPEHRFLPSVRVLLLFLALAVLSHPPPVAAADEAQWAMLDEEVIRLASSQQIAAAQETAEKAVTIARALFGEDARTAQSLTLLAEIHMLAGAWSDAEPLLLEGMAIRERMLDPLDAMHEESLNLLGTVYMQTGRYAEAERHFQLSRERAIRAAEQGLDGPQAPRWADIVAAQDFLARLHQVRGETEAMQRTHGEMLDTIARYAPGYPTSLESAILRHYIEAFDSRNDDASAERALRTEADRAGREGEGLARAEALHGIARIADRARRLEESAVLHTEAHGLAQGVLESDDPRLVKFLRYAGEVEFDAGRTAPAEALFRNALSIVERTEPHEAFSKYDVAATASLLADILESDGRFGEAEPLRRRTLSIYRPIYGDSAWMTARSHRHLAINLLRQGKLDEADEHFTAAVTATPGDRRFTDLNYLQSRLQRVEIALRRGDLAAIAERWREMVALRAEVLGLEAARTAHGLQELSALARLAGLDHPPELPEAVATNDVAGMRDGVMQQFNIDLEHLLIFTRGNAPPTDPQVHLTGITIEAELLAAAGETVRAARTYHEALDLAVELHGEEHASVRRIAERLVELYRAADRRDRAAPVARRFGLDP
ncbi:MAG TPA: tetratricopeptide repeat protein [Xanthomonadaceae bacterium]|nr:tetratricopeptide repeat protein [Xanthomonadaceae bacterium]